MAIHTQAHAAACVAAGAAALLASGMLHAGPAPTPIHDEAAEAERQANPGKVVADREEGFRPAYRIEADGRVLDTGAWDASPFLIDWDNDGDRDLLIGVLHDKHGICLYTNTGDDTTPKYTNSGWLKVAGYEPLAVPGIA